MELNSTFREEERRQGRSSKVSGNKKKSLWRLYIKGGGGGGNSSLERGDLACAALFFFRKVFFTVFPFTKRVRPGGAGGRWSLPPSLPHWPSYGRGKQGKMGNRGRRNRRRRKRKEDLWEPQPRRRRILYFLPSRLPPPPVRTGQKQNSSPGFPFQEEKKPVDNKGGRKLNVAASNSGGEGKKGCVCSMQKG